MVYEVETEPDPETVRDKAERYTRPWIVWDCLVLDLRERPGETAVLSEWVRGQVVG